MRLRIRLIVAFLLLGVLPLGAVTTYSYLTNRRALEAAASREADQMAGELSARMMLVTSELGQSLQRLIDVPAEKPAATRIRVAEKKSAEPVETPAVAQADLSAAIDAQVADTLGSAAMLLNSVDVPRPLRPGEPRGPRRDLVPDGQRRGGRRGGPVDDLSPLARVEDLPREFPGLPRPPLVSADGHPPDAPVDAAAADPAEHVLIDLGNVRRELFRQIVPEGTSPADMTPEQRQRVAADINQRLLGIGEGIKLAAAELERKAEQARRQAADTLKTETAAPVQRKAALKGNHLDVSVEQNGKVLRAANAEINLPNVLMTVFSSVPRGQGELAFALGKDGRIYAANETNRASVEQLVPAYRPDGTSMLGDWIVVMTPGPPGSDLRLGIARPVGDSLSELRRTAGRNALLGLTCLGLALLAIVPLSGRLTKNLSTLTGGVRRIAQGDYGTRVDVRSTDEVGELAQAFNQMAAQVEAHQRTIIGQERLKRELELGRQIQHDMLPRAPLSHGVLDVDGISVSAREVGGDFFHYDALPDGQIVLVIGDVSGKGVGAALLMANIHASLRTRLSVGQELAAIVDAIDRDLEANSPGQMYATLFLGILDPIEQRLRYVNAGHLPQFHVRGDGPIAKLDSTGLPIGLLAGHGYLEAQIQLTPGDLLFFYTDGCVETESETEEMFGTERLESLVSACGGRNTRSTLEYVHHALESFRGTREPFDDATLMAARIA